LLCNARGFLSREQVFSRVLGTKQPGREASRGSIDGGLNVLVISDPTGDLAAAGKEAARLVARLKALPSVRVEHLHGPEASYRHISFALDATHRDVLHYAGHFAFDALRPGTSGLPLADNRMLTADDLATHLHVPRFVFANACESGRVSGGLPPSGADLPYDQQGLAEGLLREGVRAFLGPLWRVDDRAAETFALAVYRALLKGRTVGEAVRLARIAVVQKHDEGQPAWAGYALYGQPWMTLL
jgi:CHAT domain-containing protein